MGVAGTAGKAKTTVESFGYKVVEIGNASRFDYTSTIVSIKKSKEQTLTKLKEDLSKSYTVTVGEPLPEDKSYDVLVIIGKN